MKVRQYNIPDVPSRKAEARKLLMGQCHKSPTLAAADAIG